MGKKKDTAGAKRIGRWAPIGITPVTESWKNVNSADGHLIFLLDTASGEISVCGDASGVRAGIGASGGSALVTPPQRRKRKAPAKR